MKNSPLSMLPSGSRIPSKSILLVGAVTIALVSFSCGSAQVATFAEITSAQKRITAKLRPAVKTWVDEQATRLARFKMEEDGIEGAIVTRFSGQNLNEDGRLILNFLVIGRAADFLSQRTQLFEEYQKATQASLDKTNELLLKLEKDVEKCSELHEMAQTPPECAVYQEETKKLAGLIAKTPSWTTVLPREPLDRKDLEGLQEDLKGKLDALNELSELTSLRLQMTMDRRSKFIETLSIIMKEISTTQETQVQNLK